MEAQKKKRKGFGLRMTTLEGKDGVQYLFFKTRQGTYHAFQEIPTKNALRACGAPEGTTHQMARKKLGF